LLVIAIWVCSIVRQGVFVPASPTRLMELGHASPDHPITRSPDLLVSWAACVLALCFTTGCGAAASSGGERSDDSAGPLASSEVGVSAGAIDVRVIEAGVVFADQPGYLCFPLEEIGFDRDTAPLSVHSSCHCVTPSLVRYQAADGSAPVAILLQYVPETELQADAPQASPLAVTIDLRWADGSLQTVTINLLHTVLATVSKSEVMQ